MDGSDEPSHLGRYEVIKKLMSGGMAELLLGRATGMSSFERHVVIKRIHRVLAHDQRFVQMFLDEARLAAALHHQNIVQVYDVGEQDGEYFFAMEYVHGEDLRKLHAKARDRNEQIPLEIVISVVMQAAAGLHHAHEQRGPNLEPLELVHRDVSLGNILVGYDGSVKLLDFGLAKAALRSVKTRTGTLKGKAAYMSPEQCMGRPLDRRSDVFGLGIVLYELATARRLFKAANDFLSMAAIVNGDVPPPSAHRDGLPPGFDDLVMRALSKTRESRFASAEVMRGALEELAIDSGLRTSTKLLADYMTLTFGEKPDPWRVAETRGNTPPPEDDGIVVPPSAPERLVPNERAGSPLAVAQAIADGTEIPEFNEEAATIAEAPPDFLFEVASKQTTGVRGPIEDVHTATTTVDGPPTSPTMPSRPKLQATVPISPDTPPITDDDTTTGKAPRRSRVIETPMAPRIPPNPSARPAPAREALEDAPTAVAPSKAKLEAAQDAIYVGPPVPSRWRDGFDRHRGIVMFAIAVLAFGVVLAILLLGRGAEDLAPPDAPAATQAPPDANVPADAPAAKPPPPPHRRKTK